MANAKVNFVYDYLEPDWEVTKDEVEGWLNDNTTLNSGDLEPEFVEAIREACREYEALD